MSHLYPMLIEPRFDQRIWGGHRLANDLGKNAPPDQLIGESWEIYEANRVLNGAYRGRTIDELRREMGLDLMGHLDPAQLFPLLTKLIDAHDVLSVQVHPDDAYARSHEHRPYGKTECWYVLQADPGACLTYGFSKNTGAAEYRKLVEEGQLDNILRSLAVKAGDVVYLPARTVHAIGAGILLFELQQTSDITYRIYDWNRVDEHGKPRRLHVDEAADVLDFDRSERGLITPLGDSGGRSMLVAAEYFCLEHLCVSGRVEVSTQESPVAICALESPLTISLRGDESRLERYSSALVPAAAQSFTLEASGAAAFALVAYVPSSLSAIRHDLEARHFPGVEIDRFLAQFTSLPSTG